MANYEEMRVKLTNTQLNKLKSPAKTKTGIMMSTFILKETGFTKSYIYNRLFTPLTHFNK